MDREHSFVPDLMIENQPEMPGPSQCLRLPNHVVMQAKSSITGTYSDPQFINPLVAGSSPARPTHTPQFRNYI
jgi:hypothetical protein